MKFIFISLLSIGVLCFSSFDNPFSPDPEMFGKKLVEVIKTGDSVLYKKTFGVDTSVLSLLVENMINDPYFDREKKEKIKYSFMENKDNVVASVSNFISGNLKIIETWKTKEQIKLNSLQYLRTYYQMDYEKGEGIVVMSNTSVLVKHDTILYLLEFNDVGFVNNKWYGGKLENISKLDKNLNKSFYYSKYGNSEDLIDYAIVDSVAVDTVAAYEEPLDKKQRKLNKKIEKLQRKMDKLYQKY